MDIQVEKEPLDAAVNHTGQKRYVHIKTNIYIIKIFEKNK